MELNEIINKIVIAFSLAGIVLAFRYLDGRAKARKKFRKPKYKQYKLD